jgi:hypothetical protein
MWHSRRRSVAFNAGAVVSVGMALLASGAGAQATPGTIAGVVRSETGAPLADVLLVLDPDGAARRAETDTTGRFRFDRVGPGAHGLRVIHIGYAAVDTTLQVERAGLDVTFVLRQSRTYLDTLHVVARETGVYGTVVAGEAFTPIARATVTIMRTNRKAVTDSTGKFTLLGLAPGGHVVYATAPDRLPATLPVVVPRDTAVEVLVSMPSTSAPGAKRLALPLADFATRVRFASLSRSALVPWQEIAGRGPSLGTALRYSPSFLRTGLRLDDAACVYVDGFPRPLLTVYDIDPADVETVEVYGVGAILAGQLPPWPRFVPCGNPHGTAEERATPRVGLQRGANSGRPVPTSNVAVVVIWLKH